uniref:Uncharacterized protein n=1 Tax=Vespula pensylvanica TaxID=30213 RepID=A0A834P195_VESPE|nr:hypothetical protein H0235_009146 [Vespula pensylvanica]
MVHISRGNTSNHKLEKHLPPGPKGTGNHDNGDSSSANATRRRLASFPNEETRRLRCFVTPSSPEGRENVEFICEGGSGKSEGKSRRAMRERTFGNADDLKENKSDSSIWGSCSRKYRESSFDSTKRTFVVFYQRKREKCKGRTWTYSRKRSKGNGNPRPEDERDLIIAEKSIVSLY